MDTRRALDVAPHWSGTTAFALAALCLAACCPSWAAGVADNYSAEVIADSPASYWRLNESLGTVATDERGAGDGAIGNVTLNEPGALEGNIATCGLFSAALGSQIERANPVGLFPGAGSLTVEAWAKVRTSGSAMPIVNWDPSGFSVTVSLGAYQLLVNTDGNAEFVVTDNAGQTVTVTGSSVDDGLWHHIVGVLDRGTNLLRIYVDGEEKASEDAAALGALQNSTPSQPFQIGRRTLTPGPGISFDGWIDEVAVYLSALPAARTVERYVLGADALTVRSVGSTGAGTLRRAITMANLRAGRDTIDFGLTGASTYEIRLSTGLPAITEEVVIDGSSQAGYANQPVVGVIGPPTSSSGLVFAGGDGSTVKGLAFDGFMGPALQISSGSETTTISGCWIGLRVGGAVPAGITGSGVVIDGADDNLIGGGTAATGNVIANCSGSGVHCSGASALGSTIGHNIIGLAADGVTPAPNGIGITLQNSQSVVLGNLISGNTGVGVHISGVAATGNTLSGNTIGALASGLVAAPNGSHGVYIDGAAVNTVGGSSALDRNIISGNTGDGVRIWGTDAWGNLVLGNYIGVSASGSAALSNDDGVQIAQGAHDNTVGGSVSTAMNVIGGSRLNGVAIADTGSTGNKVQANLIGMNATNTGPVAIAGHGVLIHGGAASNEVGGTSAGQGNVIGNCTADGVAVVGASSIQNSIVGNSIHSNGGLGIDLANDGVTANDAGDSDGGSANSLQNYPTLDGAVVPGTGDSVTVVGSLDSATNSSAYPVRLEFYRAGTVDSSGHGEGVEYLGSHSVNGPGTFSVTLAATLTAGTVLSATATDWDGNTSEFSGNVTASGPASRLAFKTSPANTTAGQVLNPQPIVQIEDSVGRRVWTATNSVRVDALVPPATAVTLGGTVTVAAVAGQAVFGDLHVDTARTACELRATAAGLTGAASTSFDVAAGSVNVDHTGITADQATATADGADTVTLTITARDEFDNPVAGVPGADLVVAGTPTTGLSVQQPTAATDAAGQTTASATCTHAGAVTFSVSLDSVAAPTTAQTTFEAGAAAAPRSSLTVDQSTATADGVDAVTVTITVRDAHDNPVPNLAPSNIVVSGSPSGSLVLTQPSAATDANGRATATATRTRTGRVTFSATIAGAACPSTADTDFQPGPPVASASGLVVDPTTATADGADAVTLTITARDAQGNPVPGVAASRMVIAASPSAGVSISQPTAATDAGGLTTATATSTRAGTIAFSGQLDGADLANVANVDFGAGAVDAATSTVVSDVASCIADGADAATLTITLRDAHGNPVAGVPANQIQVSGNPGAGLGITQPTVATDAAGQTTATVAGTVAGSVTFSVVAQSAALGDTAQVDFVAGAVDAGQTTVTVDRAVIRADGVDQANITVTARDAHGNAIAGIAASAVVLRVNPTGQMTLDQPTAATDSEGRAMGALRGTAARTVTVSARVSGVDIAQTVDVTLQASVVDGARSGLEAAPTSVTADGLNTVTFTVTLHDGLGNPVAGVAANRLAISAAPGAGITIAQPSLATDAQGQTTASATGTAAGSVTFTALLDGGPLGGTAVVTFLPGPVDAAASDLVADKTTALSDGAEPVTLTVTLRDAHGNPVPGVAAGRLRVNGSEAAALSLTQPSAPTNAQGQTTATATRTRTGPVTFGATLDGASLSGSPVVDFVAAAPDAAHCQLVLDKTTAVADGAEQVRCTLTVRDAHDNPVANVAANRLRLAATPSAGTDIAQPTVGTDALGQTTATMTGTRAGHVDIALMLDGSPAGSPAPLDWTAGAVNHARCLLTADKGSAVADGVEVVTFTAELRDAHDNPVPNVAGSRLDLISSAPSAARALVGAFGDGDAEGRARATVTSTQSGSETFTLTVDGGPAGAAVTIDFVAGPVDEARSDLVSDVGSAVADGSAAVTLTLTLRDAHGNAKPGVAPGEVTFAAVGGLGDGLTLTGPSAPSDAEGRMTMTAVATRPQTVTLNVAVPGAAWAAPVSFTPRPVDAAQSTVTIEPGVIAADGRQTATLTATLRDATGALVEGSPPGERTLDSGSLPITLLGTGEATGPDGEFTLQVTCDEPGQADLVVSVGSVALAPVSLTARPYLDLNLPAGLHFAGLPMTPDAGSLADLLSTEGLRAMRWDAVAQAYAPAAVGDGYVPGQGLWVRAAGPVQVRLLGEPTPADAQRLPLARGWNALANPFAQPLGWDLAAIGVEVDGSLVGSLADQSLWTSTIQPYGWAWADGVGYRLVFDPTRLGFESALGALPPAGGVWVQALTDHVTLVLPAPGPAPLAARRAAGTRDWAVALGVRQGAAALTGRLVGVSSDLGRALDLAQPPAADGQGALGLTVLNADGRRLAGSLHTPADRQDWELEVTSASREEVLLTWPSLGRSLPRGLVLELTDPTSGASTLLNTRSAWRWQPTRAGETRRLRLTARLGHVARSAITALALAGSRGGSHTVSLTLSAPAEVTLSVRGLGGRLVKQMSQSCVAGTTALVWDGTDSEGRAVPRGVYRLEAQATAANGAVDKAVRTVTVR